MFAASLEDSSAGTYPTDWMVDSRKYRLHSNITIPPMMYPGNTMKWMDSGSTYDLQGKTAQKEYGKGTREA